MRNCFLDIKKLQAEFPVDSDVVYAIPGEPDVYAGKVTRIGWSRWGWYVQTHDPKSHIPYVQYNPKFLKRI